MRMREWNVTFNLQFLHPLPKAEGASVEHAFVTMSTRSGVSITQDQGQYCSYEYC